MLTDLPFMLSDEISKKEDHALHPRQKELHFSLESQAKPLFCSALLVSQFLLGSWFVSHFVAYLALSDPVRLKKVQEGG